jgi:hypothetical protein
MACLIAVGCARRRRRRWSASSAARGRGPSRIRPAEFDQPNSTSSTASSTPLKSSVLAAHPAVAQGRGAGDVIVGARGSNPSRAARPSLPGRPAPWRRRPLTRGSELSGATPLDRWASSASDHQCAPAWGARRQKVPETVSRLGEFKAPTLPRPAKRPRRHRRAAPPGGGPASQASGWLGGREASGHLPATACLHPACHQPLAGRPSRPGLLQARAGGVGGAWKQAAHAP